MSQRLTPVGSGRVAVPIRFLLIAAVGFGAACTSTIPEVVDESPEPVVVEPTPEPEQEPAPVVEEAPEPPAVEEPVTEIEPPMQVLVLRSSDAPSYADVAHELDAHLATRYEIVHANYAELDASTRHRLGSSTPKVVIAIGLDAARFAATELTLPTIVCQIYELAPLLALRDTVFGVAALPPPALQLAAWKELAPNVSSAGLLVSEGDEDLVAAAGRAASEVGVELHVEYVASDRELLYRFKRLAPGLDGLWLVPDNDILSPPVLRDVLSYALVHRVHSIVFNPSLLSWGALLSVGGSAAGVATAATGVLDAIAAGNAADLPRVTELTSADVRINEEVASTLGLQNGRSRALAARSR